MSKVDKGEWSFAETLKPANLKEKVETRITEIKQIGTKYGDKRVAVLETGEQVFLNAMSLQNLVTAFGDETDKWIGQEISLEVEVSERTQGKQAIVISAKTEKKK